MDTPRPGPPHPPGPPRPAPPRPGPPGQNVGSPSPSKPAGAGAPGIQPPKPGIGGARLSGAGFTNEGTLRPAPGRVAEERGLPVAEAEGPAVGAKITAFGKEKRHEDVWSRTPNTTGAGAIHVKTFHCKLTEDALVFMDQGINEWLDAHPQYEVKFVSSTIGTFSGKLKEPALICQVWV